MNSLLPRETRRPAASIAASPLITIRPSKRAPGWSLRPLNVDPLTSLRPLAMSLRPLPALGPGIRVLPARRARALPSRLQIGAGVALATIAGGFALHASAREAHHAHPVVQVISAGTAGLRETASGAHERWGTAPVTVTLDPSLDAIGPSAKEAVKSALGAWLSSGVPLPPVTFDTSADGTSQASPGGGPHPPAREAVQDGVNTILFAPITTPGHEKDLAITIGYMDSVTGQILEADTVFNADYDFGTLAGAEPGEGDEPGAYEDNGTDCQGRYDLQNVATHEAGHFFGLGEDMEDTQATMYLRSAPCQTHKRTLTKPDLTIMTSLYSEAAPGPAASSGAAKGCSVAGAAGSGGSAPLAVFFFGVGIVFAGRRRRALQR